MPTWNPNQYLTFADERLRPALDLLAQIPLSSAADIVDLGCGPGNVAPFLLKRWPEAAITGVDSSPAMLEKARAALSGATWREADIAGWRPAAPPDLIYSNAALHWLPDHDLLFTRLLSFLAPGGVFAVQMPATGAGAWRRAAQEAAAGGPWAEKLTGLIGKAGNVKAPDDYYRIMGGNCASLDIWQTDYLHILSGPDPVAHWTKGAGLRPYLDRLAGDEQQAFFEAYAARLRDLYPAEPDGHTLMPFRRLFIVAIRQQS